MSPHQVIPRQVASLQSPLPFHLVSLFRWLSGSFLHTLAYNGKRYWPSSCKMSPCCEASVMASCAVRLEHFERSEEHTSELQSLTNLVCRLLLEKKNINDAVGGMVPTVGVLLHSASKPAFVN